jgi:hypothetical protein
LRAVRARALLVFASLFLFACSTARYRDREGYDASCPTQIEYPCKAGPRGASDSCEPDPNANETLASEIPLDASYPYPCTIIIPVPIADENGQCVIAGSCRCDRLADGGIGWICVQSHY